MRFSEPQICPITRSEQEEVQVAAGIVLEEVATPGNSTRPGAADPRPGDGPLDTRRTMLIAATTFTTAVAILFRYGYSFGLFDQTVYSLRGIALADPDAFAQDWFARTVPQPHWLFDVLTYVGTRLGTLPAIYLLYWLSGIVVFAVGSVWLAERFLPRNAAWAAALGPLVVLGPSKLLGTTTPLLWFANPHMLGGCLAFLALAALLTGRWRTAAAVAVAAGVFHVQHGANLAPVLVLVALLNRQAARRDRVLLIITAAFLIGGAAGVASWRGLETTGDQWITTCKVLIPFHCDAPSWSVDYLLSGAAVPALALGLVWWARRDWRTVHPVIGLPAAGVLLGVGAERFELGALGRLAAQYNVHRLATLVEPFAALALLCFVAWGVSLASPRRAAYIVAAAAGIGLWSALSDGALRPPGRTGGVVVLALVGVILTVFRPEATRVSPFTRRLLLSAAVLVMVVAGLNGALGHLGYDPNLPSVQAGRAVKRVVSEEGIIAAPPEITWLRPLSRRSVIADCKAVPYGGPPWEEYMRRIGDLGGKCRGTRSGFRDLTPADLEALRGRYGATHVLLYSDDSNVAYARAHWHEVLTVRAQNFDGLGRGLILFDMNHSTP